MERGIQIKGAEDPDPRAFDTDAVLVSQEEIEEQFAQVRLTLHSRCFFKIFWPLSLSSRGRSLYIERWLGSSYSSTSYSCKFFSQSLKPLLEEKRRVCKKLRKPFAFLSRVVRQYLSVTKHGVICFLAEKR